MQFLNAGLTPQREEPKLEAFRTLGRHWVNGIMLTTGTNYGWSYSSNVPKHHPANETIQDVTITGDHAKVETAFQWLKSLPDYYVYSLLRQGGEWQMSEIRHYNYGRDTFPEAAASLSGAELPEYSSFAGQIDLDLEQAFRPQQILIDDRPVSIRVEAAGTLVVRSGYIIASDCAYFIYATPFAMKIRPGEYRVILSLDGSDSVGSVKFIIRPGEPAVAFVPAKLLGETDEGPTYLSVDGGCLGFADARTALAQNNRVLEELSESLCEAGVASTPSFAPAFASIDNDSVPDAVLISSGYGDGGYACYWGLNANGEPVSLVADFAIYGSSRAMECVIPFPAEPLDGELVSPVLAEHGFTVHLRREDATIAVTEKGGQMFEAILMDRIGNVIADTNRCGSETGYKGRTTFLKNVPVDFSGGQLAFRWRVWEHAFARKAP